MPLTYLEDFLSANSTALEILRDTSVGHTEVSNKFLAGWGVNFSETAVRRARGRRGIRLEAPAPTPEPVAETREPRVLLYDIETSFQIGGFFGPRHNTNIAKVLQPTYVLGFAYKWLGEEDIYTDYIWDYDLTYNDDPTNDLQVVQSWSELISEADIAVGHNVDAFDNKVMQARNIVHGRPPVHLPQTMDTLKVARRVARFDGNKLDELGQLLGYGRKEKTDIDLWWDCMNGVPEAMKRMEEYNIRDVDLLEKVHDHLKPYDTRYPNIANITSRPDACPTCGVEGRMQARGVVRTATATYKRFNCQACGSWSRARLSDRDGKPNYV